METNEEVAGNAEDYDNLVDSLLVLGQHMVKYGFIRNIPTRTDVVSDSFLLNVNRFDSGIDNTFMMTQSIYSID